MSTDPEPARRKLRLRYPATCATCGADLPAKTEAYWDSAAKLATCISCEEVEAAEADANEAGEAGGSALAKAQDLGDRRAAAARKRWGDQAAKVAARMAQEDPSIRAWDKGGHGESRLGSFIAREVGDAVIALHDRLIPGLNGQNIDHLFIAPSGVWIVDAKTYKGKMERRDAGPIWRADFQIYVGGRNRTKLVDGMTNQIRAVRFALEEDPAAEHIELHPALCFIDTEWGLFQRPFNVRGVLVMYPGALRSSLRKDGPLSRTAMERIAETLALSLPAATGRAARR